VPAVAVGLASLLLAVALNTDRATPPAPAPVARAVAAPVVDLFSDPPSAGDDTALNLVAELSSDMDFDAAREAGLAVGGGAEHAVTHMDSSELRELRRLLQEELARSGA
jgi:hypothetical protein